MRTALFLLLLLAIGAMPGSIFPQRAIDAGPHRRLHRRAPHRRAVAGPARVLRGLRLAVVRRDLPAALRLARRLRPAPHPGALPRRCASAPPRAPRRLERLAAHGDVEVDGDARGGPRAAAEAALRGRRFRVHAHDDELRQRREGLPARDRQPRLPPRADRRHRRRRRRATSSGGRATSSCPWGKTFANTLSRYDTFSPGPWVDANDLAPFTLTLDRLDATFEDEVTGPGPVRCSRATSGAHVTATDEPASRRPAADRQVNHPLEIGRRLGLPARQRLRARRSPCATPTATVLYSRRDAVPAAGQQLHVGRRDQGARRRRRSSSASRASSCRPAIIDEESGPHSVFPDALEPAARADGLRGRPVPRAAGRSRSTPSTPRR